MKNKNNLKYYILYLENQNIVINVLPKKKLEVNPIGELSSYPV